MGLLNLKHKLDLNHQIGQGVEHPELLQTQKWWEQTFTAAWGVKEIRIEVMRMLDWLKGKKTYVVAALAAVVTMLHYTGQIDDATYQSLLALLGAGGAAAVAAKINRLQK